MVDGEPDNPWDRDSFDWPLTAPAVVVEVGGFTGRWVSGMASRYPGVYHVFEPQPWAAERLRQRFETESLPGADLVLHRYAIGPAPAQVLMGGWETDAASILLDDRFYERHPEEGRRERGVIEVREVGDVFRAHEALAGPIDVMMMNIEGYEFQLLPVMIDLGIIERVRFLCVQFHLDHDPLGPRLGEARIRERLERTHRIRFDYPDGVLTCWERIPAN